jgi:hypothetical protein
VKVVEKAKGAQVYDELVKYLLMVRKKQKDSKVRGTGQGLVVDQAFSTLLQLKLGAFQLTESLYPI